MPALLTLPDITDATRREFLALLGAAGLLAGCSTDAGDPGPESPTRPFVDGRGVTVEVPASPQRIVALNGNGGQQLLSLGAPLVGLATRDGELDAKPELLGLDAAVLAGIEPVGDYGTPDLEAVAALRPDLIVAHGSDGASSFEPFHDADVLGLLGAIAPTIVMNTFRPVDEVMTAFGSLLGAPGEVEDQQAAYEQRIGELRGRLPYDPADLRVASVYLDGDQLSVNGRELGTLTYVLDALGVSWSPITDEADAEEGQIRVSYERVGALDGDMVFRHAFTEPSATVLGLFDQLPAGRAGQVVDEPNIFGQTYATYGIGIDFLEPILLAADPTVVP